MQAHILPVSGVIIMDTVPVKVDEFISLVAEKTGLQKIQTKATLNAMIEVLCEILMANKSLKLHNFGVFKVQVYNVRTGRNVFDNTGLQIPERKRVVFKPGKMLRQLFKEEM